MKLSTYLLIGVIVLGFFLRFYRLDSLPPGLYIDEVAIGNDAFSILNTGRDQFGRFMPLWFESYGDYKMPGYIYAVSVSMAVFGKNEFAVRFPSAIAGVLTIILAYLFLKKLIVISTSKKNIIPKRISIITAFLLAISPWHIHFSRGGFEVNLALFFYMFGLTLLAYFEASKRTFLLYLSFLTIILSSYTYHSFRLIVPLTIIGYFIYWYYKRKTISKEIILPTLFSFILFLPLFFFSTTSYGSERFSQTSAFVEYKAESLVDKIILYPMIYVKNYISYFSTHFLFNFGDGIGRHQMARFGIIPKWEAAFLFLGLFIILTRFKKYSYIGLVIIFLLLLSPIPGSLVRPSPHSLRAFLMVIPLTMLSAIGISYILNLKSYVKKYLMFAIVFIALVEFSYYIHHYYIHYPNVNVMDWGQGYKQLVYKVENLKSKYDYVLVDANLNSAPSYFKFYSDIQITMTNEKWVKPKEWNNKKVLLVRPNYNSVLEKNHLDNVYLNTTNREVFAEIWER